MYGKKGKPSTRSTTSTYVFSAPNSKLILEPDLREIQDYCQSGVLIQKFSRIFAKLSQKR